MDADPKIKIELTEFQGLTILELPDGTRIPIPAKPFYPPSPIETEQAIESEFKRRMELVFGYPVIEASYLKPNEAYIASPQPDGSVQVSDATSPGVPVKFNLQVIAGTIRALHDEQPVYRWVYRNFTASELLKHKKIHAHRRRAQSNPDVNLRDHLSVPDEKTPITQTKINNAFERVSPEQQLRDILAKVSHHSK